MAARFDGKRALVTGAASGMGQAIATALVADGGSVALLDLNEEALTAVTDEVEKSGTALGIPTNVADADSVDQAVTRTADALGGIDIVINAAGILDGYANLADTDLELWNRIIGIDLTGSFLVSRAALPHLLENEQSSIVNFSSISGLVANGGGVAYTAAKHGVIGMTKQIQADYGHQGLRCNAVLPGAVETGMTRKMFEEGDPATMETISSVPAGRFAQPEEIANVVLFLASDEASFVYGAAYPVDGGWTVK